MPVASRYSLQVCKDLVFGYADVHYGNHEHHEPKHHPKHHHEPHYGPPPPPHYEPEPYYADYSSYEVAQFCYKQANIQ